MVCSFLPILDKLAGWFAGIAEKKFMTNFNGRWFTTFGPMELTQDGDGEEGFYNFQQNRCAIEGSISDSRFQFRYQKPTVEGEGWFEMVRHGRFAGQWRPKGHSIWSNWIDEREFEGIWDSSFGLLRLVQEPDRVFGFYEGIGPSSADGRVENNRLTFRYRETRAQGEGFFELAPDATSFQGEWRADGAEQWAPWRGRRVAPVPGAL